MFQTNNQLLCWEVENVGKTRLSGFNSKSDRIQISACLGHEWARIAGAQSYSMAIPWLLAILSSCHMPQSVVATRAFAASARTGSGLATWLLSDEGTSTAKRCAFYLGFSSLLSLFGVWTFEPSFLSVLLAACWKYVFLSSLQKAWACAEW